jgi:hypothetical protein
MLRKLNNLSTDERSYHLSEPVKIHIAIKRHHRIVVLAFVVQYLQQIICGDS